MEIDVVGEIVLYERGPYRVVRRYLSGWHPHLGILHMGLSGKETIVEQQVITPSFVLKTRSRGILYVNRGLPGSGKSTRTRRMALVAATEMKSFTSCSSDDFFTSPCCGKYNFSLDKLKYAHEWCQQKCREALVAGVDMVVIDNTNCSAWECKVYVLLGQQHDYDIVFLEPETPWAFDVAELEWRNTHNVPRAALERMLARWVPNMTIEKALGVEQPGHPTEDEKASGGKGAACSTK